MSRFTYDGLDRIERMISLCGKDVAYIQIWDRTAREKEDNLGRFEMDLPTAEAFLATLGERDEPEEEVDEDAEEPDDREEEDGSSFHLGAAFGEDTRRKCAPSRDDETMQQRIQRAASLWLRDIAERNALGDPCRRFRVKIFGPKGIRIHNTGSFLVRDDDALDAPQSNALAPQGRPPTEIPTPSYEVMEREATAQGMRALGDYYAQWGRMVLGSVHQLQGVSNASTVKLHQQLDASRDQVDQLLAAIISQRASEAEAVESRALATRQDDARADVAKHAIAQLADAAKAILSTRGLPPETTEIVTLLAQNPELAALVSDPGVRRLLADPNNVRMAAAMLRELSANQAAAGAQAA